MIIKTPFVKNDKGCFMFTVQPFCRIAILSACIVVILLINITAKDFILIILSTVFFVWRCRYFITLKIFIYGDYMIKQTGNFFKQKTIIMLKNISRIQIFNIHSCLPTLIQLHCYNKAVYIFGLNSTQRSCIEKYILRLK